MKREILFTIAVTLVLAGIIRAAQDGTGTNVFESVRIKDGRSVTFGGVARTNWPEGGSTVFGVTDETAYRGDWGAVISNLVIYGPLLTNTTDVFFGRGAYAGYGGIAIGAGATNEEGGIAIGKDSRSGLVGISIGLFAQSAELGVSIGRFAEADMYGIAIGDNASAVEDAVAIGDNVKNTNANTTKILGKLIIPGGGPTNGAVWIATNTAGLGKWSRPVSFYASLTNANFLITNNVLRKILWEPPFGAVEYNLNASFSDSTFTAPVSGIYQFSAKMRWGRKSGSGAYIVYLLYINGGIAQRFPSDYSTAYTAGYCNFPPIVQKLNAGDTVYLAAIGTAATTNYIGSESMGPQNTFFNGVLLREIP